MPYRIRYNTVVADSPCSVTLRGLYEDGRYWGYVHVRNPSFGFNCNIEGYFREDYIEEVFNSIEFLKRIEFIEIDGISDCVICGLPQFSQEVYFSHYIDYEYDNETSQHYNTLINLLKNEFDAVIQDKICKYKKGLHQNLWVK